MQRLVGIGLYDVREAARLASTKPQSIRRWLSGYSAQGTFHEPLWHPPVDIDGDLTLDFRDLMEVRAVTTFRRCGIGLQTLRRAILKASIIVNHDRPLSTRQFKTDGARIFFEEVDPVTGEKRIEDIFTGQRQMREVIQQTLMGIDFVDDVPDRWWPRGRRGGVVLDPRRSFGQPIEFDTSIPTKTLARAAEVEGSAQAAAGLYEVPIRAVRRAIKFERELAAAA